MHDVYQRWGLAHTAVDMCDLDAVAAAIRPETALVWTETPSNPLLKVTDIAAVADLAHRAGALLVVDSTFASPYLQQPIALGADLVIHSTTKYLSGHSDITGGAVIAADEQVGATISRHVGMLGTAAAPYEAWLVQRGVKTLPVPMRQICASSQRIAEFLAAQPAVRRVHYPGLPGHLDHLLAAKQMPGGFGGVVSVTEPAYKEANGGGCSVALGGLLHQAPQLLDVPTLGGLGSDRDPDRPGAVQKGRCNQGRARGVDRVHPGERVRVQRVGVQHGASVRDDTGGFVPEHDGLQVDGSQDTPAGGRGDQFSEPASVVQIPP